MSRDTASVDIGDLPELVQLAKEVRDSGEPCVLKHDGQELAVLAPVERARAANRAPKRRTQQPSENNWLLSMIGLGSSEGPTDVSSNKHKYLADAYYRNEP